MSRKDTIEAEVLDAAYANHGGESSWAAFGAGRMDPAEIVERMEAGEVPEGVARGVILGVMLDLVLEGWARECDLSKVGEKVRGLASAWGHCGGKGVLPMHGAVKLCGGWAAKETAVRVLDSWFWDGAEGEELGKRVLAIGRFFNHAELEGWTVRQLAKAFGESRTWTAKRVRKECNAPIEASGGRVKATWQQGQGQREKSREARVKSFQRSKQSAAKNNEENTEK